MTEKLPASLAVVLGVLLTGGDDLDHGYLQLWPDRLGLGDVLNRASSEVGES